MSQIKPRLIDVVRNKRSVEKESTTSEQDPHWQNIDWIAYILDDLIPIPGTSMRIGLDPIIGLIPGAGDIISSAFSYVIVFKAAQGGASTLLIIRMLKNIALDVSVGVIPIFGDLFDAAHHSNRKNLNLWRSFTASQQHRAKRSPGEIKQMFFLIGLSAFATIVIIIFAAVFLLSTLL